VPNVHSLLRIQNPLAHITQESLLRDVNKFAHSRGLTEILPLLRKGALVARDPTNYEDISGDETLSDAEVDALRDEILHKWRQPLALYLTIITCSVGAAVQGWDQTGSNGNQPISCSSSWHTITSGREHVSWLRKLPLVKKT